MVAVMEPQEIEDEENRRTTRSPITSHGKQPTRKPPNRLPPGSDAVRGSTRAPWAIGSMLTSAAGRR